jgi:hypothetical protein
MVHTERVVFVLWLLSHFVILSDLPLLVSFVWASVVLAVVFRLLLSCAYYR